MELLQKKRSEIDEKYKWDLTLIYKNKLELDKDFSYVKNSLNKFKKYQKTLCSSAKNLYDFVSLDTKVSIKLEKLYIYSHLLSDSDLSDNANQELFGKIDNLFHDYIKATDFFKPLLLQEDYNKIKSFYKDYTKLNEYKFIFEKIFRYKKHTLNEQEEKIVSELSKSLSASSNIYEKLSDVDLKFGNIIDEEGHSIEFTDSNYSKYICSQNREVRKSAFELLYKGYSSIKNSLASTYSSRVELECALARIYKYKNALEMNLFEDNVKVSVYDNLINVVNDNLSSIHKYYSYRKNYLNLDTQHLYDTMVSLIDDSNKHYSFKEAKFLVINALSILGEDYVKTLNKAFDERWIDVYNNVAKRGGAYSSGSYATNPYILLNYEDELNDVSTLAHELGHSMHSYFSNKSNPYQYSNYTIFVAEVASTVNELLLSNYLLKNSQNKEEKIIILNKQLELYKATIFRQTMFAEFEKFTHEANLKGEILTNEFLENKWLELVTKYFGDAVYIDEEIKYEWSRIPHFYSNFYVYKYVTGLAAATYIVDGILNNKENALKKYRKFLTLGGSMYPLDELKVAGVDMMNSEVIKSSINYFDKTLDELIKLLGSR